MTAPFRKKHVTQLGKPGFPSPLRLSSHHGEGLGTFVPEDTWVRWDIEVSGEESESGQPLFEKAGPREKLFFDPSGVRAAIVTCGGLCPGLNNVIRSAFLELHHHYKVKEVLGLRYGYRGLNPARGHEPLLLTPALVNRIVEMGGTILGTSRGNEDPGVMTDFLQSQAIDVLFCVGGDGTMRGAHAIHEEAARRGAPIAVVGIPKTIDNDIQYCLRTFGYSTALERARDALECAHNEATSAINGIGLVKVMGRDSGFIAVGATLSSQDVNFTLIPEVPFDLDGSHGFLQALEDRLRLRGHAVIVVAEGAGQHLFDVKKRTRDASGNVLHHDIGLLLKESIATALRSRDLPFDLKYIDPSYTIRSVPANGDDSILCDQFARHAVHAALSGRTNVMVGFCNSSFVHIPIPMATTSRRKVDPEGDAWRSVLSATGQPAAFTKDAPRARGG
jgi:6-phosphofructokinase 1